MKKIKSKYIHLLFELELKYLQNRYPSVPDGYHATTKWNDKTANGLEKAICFFLNKSGYQAERIKNTGRFIDNKKTVIDYLGHSRTIGTGEYIKGTGTNGTSDISAIIKGRAIKIEVKMKDKQSSDQKKYQQSIESAGGIYWLVHSFDEFYENYLNMLKKQLYDEKNLIS